MSAHSCSFGFWQMERPKTWNDFIRTQFRHCGLHLELTVMKSALLSSWRKLAISAWSFGMVAHSFASYTNHIALFQSCFPSPIPDFWLLKADCSCRGHLLLLEYKSKGLPYELQGLYITPQCTHFAATVCTVFSRISLSCSW